MPTIGSGVYNANPTYKRSKSDNDKDFALILQLRSEGKTWQAITDLINSENEYTVTLQANYLLYQNRLKLITKQRQEDDVIDEIDSYFDFVIGEGIKGYESSKGVQKQTEIKTEEKQLINKETGEVEGTKRIVDTKTVERFSSGDPRFLTQIINAAERKANLHGVNKGASSSIINILNNIVIDDSPKEEDVIPIPIRSEREMIKLNGGEKDS